MREELLSKKDLGLDLGNSQPVLKTLNLENSLVGKCALGRKPVVILANYSCFAESDSLISSVILTKPEIGIEFCDINSGSTCGGPSCLLA